MCGVAGTLAVDGAIAPGLIERMCATLGHRGPDSEGYFEQDGVALGVARLAVIDPEAGAQPIFNEDESLLIVCNGEIYNYVELRRELEGRGHRFRTGSDSEVIVHLYEDLGEDCVQRLRGMFAFAIWDRRQRRLFAARDRVGKKPFFYAALGGRFWFASEPRAILADEAVPRDIDVQAIDLYLHYQVVPAPLSAFEAIRKLRPAHALTWQGGTVRTRRYWKLSYRDRVTGLSEEAAAELIREALLEATRLRLRSDRPIGALLSGGVDSSAVVAAMAKQSSETVKTFSIGFDVPRFDETVSSREVARLYATDHHEVILDESAMELLPRLAWHYGEPFGDSSALATFALAELAGQHVTVVLNGDGGDENFGGYARHASSSTGDLLVRRYAESRSDRYFDEPTRHALFEPGVRPDHEWRAVLEEPYRVSDAEVPGERTLDVDVQTYLPDDLLVKMDIAMMAHSVEARSPLCDQELMALAAGLPMGMKIAGTTHKAIFKRAMREWLPPSITDRPKMGFMIPMGAWLRNELVAELLLDPRALGRGLFRPERIVAMVHEHAAGRGEHEHRLWLLVMLELWMRTYIDQAPASQPVALSAA